MFRMFRIYATLALTARKKSPVKYGKSWHKNLAPRQSHLRGDIHVQTFQYGQASLDYIFPVTTILKRADITLKGVRRRHYWADLDFRVTLRCKQSILTPEKRAQA